MKIFLGLLNLYKQLLTLTSAVKASVPIASINSTPSTPSKMEATLGAIASGEFQTTLRQQVFITMDGSRFQATFSLGVAEYPSDGLTFQSLYRVPVGVFAWRAFLGTRANNYRPQRGT